MKTKPKAKKLSKTLPKKIIKKSIVTVKKPSVLKKKPLTKQTNLSPTLTDLQSITPEPITSPGVFNERDNSSDSVINEDTSYASSPGPFQIQTEPTDSEYNYNFLDDERDELNNFFPVAILLAIGTAILLFILLSSPKPVPHKITPVPAPSYHTMVIPTTPPVVVAVMPNDIKKNYRTTNLI
jgi:hypothetical protein